MEAVEECEGEWVEGKEVDCAEDEVEEEETEVDLLTLGETHLPPMWG